MFIWLESKETHFSSILLICIEFISLLKHANNSLFGKKKKKKKKMYQPFQVAICLHRVS